MKLKLVRQDIRYPAKIKNLSLGEETGDRRQEIGDRRIKNTIDQYNIHIT
jgi:hypothetical protein